MLIDEISISPREPPKIDEVLRDFIQYFQANGTAVAQWLRCCATNRKVAGSIPAVVSVDRGSTVVKVLCYKSEGRWFDPSWCQW